MTLFGTVKKQPRSSQTAAKIVARFPGAKSVGVTGDFSGWKDEGIPMKKRDGDWWEVELALEPGEYEYRLRVDGRWEDHPDAKRRVPNRFGSENCVLTVS